MAAPNTEGACGEIESQLGAPLSTKDQITSLLKTLPKQTVNIVVIGRFRVGKSTLIDAMLNAKYLPYITRDINGIDLVDGNIRINIYDSNGLQDGKNSDKAYLRSVKEKCQKISLIIYCTKLGEPIRKDEKIAINGIESVLGESIFKNIIIALTFANEALPADPEMSVAGYFKETFDKKKTELKKCFDGITDDSFYPVGAPAVKCLPTGEKWLEKLWLGCLNKVCHSGLLPKRSSSVSCFCIGYKKKKKH